MIWRGCSPAGAGINAACRLISFPIEQKSRRISKSSLRHPPSNYLIHWTDFLSLFYFPSLFTFLFRRAFKIVRHLSHLFACRLSLVCYTFSSYNKLEVCMLAGSCLPQPYPLSGLEFSSVPSSLGNGTQLNCSVVRTSFFYFLSILSLIL